MENVPHTSVLVFNHRVKCPITMRSGEEIQFPVADRTTTAIDPPVYELEALRESVRHRIAHGLPAEWPHTRLPLHWHQVEEVSRSEPMRTRRSEIYPGYVYETQKRLATIRRVGPLEDDDPRARRIQDDINFRREMSDNISANNMDPPWILYYWDNYPFTERDRLLGVPEPVLPVNIRFEPPNLQEFRLFMAFLLGEYGDMTGGDYLYAYWNANPASIREPEVMRQIDESFAKRQREGNPIVQIIDLA